YDLLPRTGAVIGLGTYFVIRGGFVSPTTSAKDTSPYSFVGVAFLIGLFSAQASEKLKHIFEAMFTVPPQGKDHVPPTPPDFSLEARPAEARLGSRPSPVTYAIVAKSAGSFASSVALTCSPLPSGVGGVFVPPSLTPTEKGATSELTLTPPAPVLPARSQTTVSRA